MENVKNNSIKTDKELFDSIFKSLESIEVGIEKVNAILDKNMSLYEKFKSKINK